MFDDIRRFTVGNQSSDKPLALNSGYHPIPVAVSELQCCTARYATSTPAVTSTHPWHSASAGDRCSQTRHAPVTPVTGPSHLTQARDTCVGRGGVGRQVIRSLPPSQTDTCRRGPPGSVGGVLRYRQLATAGRLFGLELILGNRRRCGDAAEFVLRNKYNYYMRDEHVIRSKSQMWQSVIFYRFGWLRPIWFARFYLAKIDLVS